MKILKQAVCIALSACLLLAGCSKSIGDASAKQNLDSTQGKNTNVAMGRYIEQIIDLPAGNLHPCIVAKDDGSLEIFNLLDGKAVCYTSTDGKNWKETSPGVLSALTEKEMGLGDLVNVFNTKDGTTYVMYRDKEYKPHLVKSTDGKTFDEITIEGWDQYTDAPEVPNTPANDSAQGVTEEKTATGEQKIKGGQLKAEGQKSFSGQKAIGMMTYPQSLSVMESGDLLIGYFDKVVRYGADGKEKLSYIGLGNNFSFAADKIMMFNKEQNAITIFNMETGDVINTVPYGSANAQAGGVSVSVGGGGSTIAADDTGALFIADERGIHRLAPGGELWETVVDGELNSMSLPSVNISSLLLDKKGGFYVLTNSETKNGLSHFAYDANTPAVPSNELSVYALENNETVRQAIGEFQRANPDVKVTFRYGKSEDGAASDSDLIRTLNTELLAGKGPDILLLDGLPIDSYIEKGVLMDLSATLKPLLDSGTLLNNIGNCYVKDGKIYSMPTRFSFPAMFGSKSDVDSARTLKSLADTVEQSTDKSFLAGNTSKGRIAQFFLTCAPAWLKENGAIDQAVLTEYLRDVKRIGDVCGDESFVQEGKPMLAEDKAAEMGYADRGMGSMTDFYTGKIKLHMQLLHGFTDLMFPIAAKERTQNGTVAPLCGQSANVFVPQGIIGINNASKQRELAVQFVQSLFSENVQDTDLNDGFPVNAKSLEKNINKEKNVSMAISIKESGETPMSASWPSKENLRMIVDLIKTLNTPSTVDTVLLEMIQNECDPFFAGEKTAEQTAANIAERTQAYLAE